MVARWLVLALLAALLLTGCTDIDKPPAGTPEERGWSGAVSNEWNRERVKDNQDVLNSLAH